MAAQERDATPEAVKPVQVPRSLKYSFTHRYGLPVVSGLRVPPALARALAVWLETGTVLVVTAPRHSGKATAIATWLGTRAERMTWVEGSDNRESGAGLDSLLEGLYEIGILTLFERMNFSTLEDTSVAFLRECTPIVMVINDAHLLADLPAFEMLAKHAELWPNARFVFLTEQPVDAGLFDVTGVTVLGANDLRDPLDALLDMSPTDFHSRAEVVENWARAHDANGGLFQLLHYLAQHFSVRRQSPELSFVNDLDGAISTLLEHRVVELISAHDGQRICLTPEFREAMDTATSAQQQDPNVAFHLTAAQDDAEIGYDEGVIFHLARAGRHPEALEKLTSLPTLELNQRVRLESVRAAAATIDLQDTTHGIIALAKRLQIALLPPLEPASVREEIQEALRRAQERALSPLPRGLDVELTIVNALGLLALGRFNDARVLGRPLADDLLAAPWLNLTSLGLAPTRAWASQAVCELFEGRIEVAARFATVARESAVKAKLPHILYISTAAVAAIEAVMGELVTAKRDLAEAQRLYRRSGWPRSVAQTAEFVARFFLARASLDVSAMSDLRHEIAVVSDVTGSLRLLMKACECFVYLHSGQASQTRVGIWQLEVLIRDPRLGALFRGLGAETVFEALLRLGEPQAAITLVEAAGSMDPAGQCLHPLLGAARLGLHDPAGALAITDACAEIGAHHSPASHTLVLLVRAAAHEMLGHTELADECFTEALLTQEASPMPYLFLMVPQDIRMALWERVAEQRQWVELRTFLATVPEGIGRSAAPVPSILLTPREMEILRALTIGGTLDEIARSHFLSRNTIKTHVRVIYKKLGVSSRSAAAEVMKRFGEQLVDDGAGA